MTDTSNAVLRVERWMLHQADYPGDDVVWAAMNLCADEWRNASLDKVEWAAKEQLRRIIAIAREMERLT